MNTLGTQNFRMIDDRDVAAMADALVQRIQDLGTTVGRNIRTWVRRSNERRVLLQLSDNLLADIGLARADVEREASKYFWQK